MIVTVCPATVAVAVRECHDELSCSVAAPLPEPPPVTFSHPLSLSAVQSQPAVVLTCTSTVPPDDDIANDVGDTT